MQADPTPVAEFRAHYRETEIGPTYSGWGHLLLTSAVSLGAIGYAAAQVRAPSALEWLTVPLTFLFANLVEYLGHRGAMHRPRPGLGILYRRHTKQHHHFYTNEAMTALSPSDWKMVLFPPPVIAFFLGGIAAPAGALLFLLASPNVAWLFVATAVAYFLSYEWLHLCYHLPADSPFGRLPGMALLRRHHTLHHDLALMGRWNFNITFPISDALFSTIWKGPTA